MIVSKLLNDGVESIDEDESNFVKYDKGDYFVEHQDISKSYRVDEPRAYTLVLQLSDESEYDGGTLIIEKQEQSKKKGTVIIFKSSLKHEVTEITNGSRIVFTNFLRKNNLTFLKENKLI
jgi:predicted 2-oxoglutarate/Fe(II)-dependent dioxygenase YbiX